jgi:hypothetical protein
MRNTQVCDYFLIQTCLLFHNKHIKYDILCVCVCLQLVLLYIDVVLLIFSSFYMDCATIGSATNSWLARLCVCTSPAAINSRTEQILFPASTGISEERYQSRRLHIWSVTALHTSVQNFCQAAGYCEFVLPI